MRARTDHCGALVRVIGAFKLLKAALLVASGFGALVLLRKNAAAVLARWIDLVPVDPRSHFVSLLLAKASRLDHTRLEELGVGTLVYAALFATEGTGLLLCRRWAEWLTIFVTASFLPFEAVHLWRRFTVGRLALLVANAVIVAYLVALRARDRARR
jgi:uncharacterized membrane protein (DUF2068 family)